MSPRISLKKWYIALVGAWLTLFLPTAWFAAGNNQHSTIARTLIDWAGDALHNGLLSFVMFYAPLLGAPFGLMTFNKE